MLLSGCRGRQAAEELAPPEIAVARQVLQESLQKWQQGQRQSGVTSETRPQIGIVDSTRGDRTLKNFTIVGPLALLGKARPFAVRLELENPAETVTVRYYVLGNDPLWIYRDEDFERTMHWEHKMSGDEADASPATSPAAR